MQGILERPFLWAGAGVVSVLVLHHRGVGFLGLLVVAVLAALTCLLSFGVRGDSERAARSSGLHSRLRRVSTTGKLVAELQSGVYRVSARQARELAARGEDLKRAAATTHSPLLERRLELFVETGLTGLTEVARAGAGALHTLHDTRRD